MKRSKKDCQQSGLFPSHQEVVYPHNPSRLLELKVGGVWMNRKVSLFFNIAVLYYHYHESCLMRRQCVCLFLFKQWQRDRSVTQAVSLVLRFKEFVERAFLCSDLQHWIKHGVHKRNQVLPSHVPSVGKVRKDLVIRSV